MGRFYPYFNRSSRQGLPPLTGMVTSCRPEPRVIIAFWILGIDGRLRIEEKARQEIEAECR